MKKILQLASFLFLLGCTNQHKDTSSNVIEAQYANGISFQPVKLKLFKKSEKVSDSISTLDLYVRIDDGDGKDFLWTKVVDGYTDLNGNKVPPTFKYNGSWPVKE